MQLIQAFGLKSKEVVSFVGAGGKTTAMFRLADELASVGRNTVTTTTTRLFQEQTQQAPFVVRLEGMNQARGLVELRRAFKQHRHVLIVSAETEDDKVLGVDPLFVDQIVALEQVEHVLIEADGARMKSFKAPSEHEPVIPASTTLLVPVVGMDILGKPLLEESVHHAERVAAIAHMPEGAPIDAQMIQRVLLDEKGGMKNRPWHAPAIPLLNRISDDAQLEAARSLAHQLLHNELIDAVALGAVQEANPVLETHRRVTAIVLAAGAGTRMRERIKQLLEWGDTTLLGHTLEAVRQADVYRRVLVLGANADLIHAQVDLSGFHIVTNAEWEEGRASSVRAGLREVGERSEAALFVNADQPFLTAEVIQMVLQKYFQTNASAVVPVYDNQRGGPVLFAREVFGQLNELKGEQGGRDLLEHFGTRVGEVSVDDNRMAIDVDTYEEYERAKSLAR